MKELLIVIPPLFAVPLVWQDIPAIAHPAVYVAVLLWMSCLIVFTKRVFWSVACPNVPWSAIALAAIVFINASIAGNEYGSEKVANWLATSLPLILWPSLVRLTRANFSSVAWGQLAAGLVVVPIIVTLDRRLYAEAAYIFVGLFAGLSVISGSLLSRLQPTYWLRPLLMPLVIVIGVVAAAGVVLSGSRGAVVATLMSLLVVPFVYGLRTMWKQLAILVAVLLLSLSIPGLWSAQVAVVEERLSAEILAASLALRMDALGEALAAFMTNPLLGIGAGRYAEISATTQYVVYPHNLILELAAEFGIVAVLLIFHLLVASWRALWQLRQTDRGAAAFALASFLFLVLNAMKMGDLSSHRLLYLWIGIAFAIRSTQSRIPRFSIGLRAKAHAQSAR